jgi:hypothetical protein
MAQKKPEGGKKTAAHSGQVQCQGELSTHRIPTFVAVYHELHHIEIVTF